MDRPNLLVNQHQLSPVTPNNPAILTELTAAASGGAESLLTFISRHAEQLNKGGDSSDKIFPQPAYLLKKAIFLLVMANKNLGDLSISTGEITDALQKISSHPDLTSKAKEMLAMYLQRADMDVLLMDPVSNYNNDPRNQNQQIALKVNFFKAIPISEYPKYPLLSLHHTCIIDFLSLSATCIYFRNLCAISLRYALSVAGQQALELSLDKNPKQPFFQRMEYRREDHALVDVKGIEHIQKQLPFGCGPRTLQLLKIREFDIQAAGNYLNSREGLALKLISLLDSRQIKLSNEQFDGLTKYIVDGSLLLDTVECLETVLIVKLADQLAKKNMQELLDLSALRGLAHPCHSFVDFVDVLYHLHPMSVAPLQATLTFFQQLNPDQFHELATGLGSAEIWDQLRSIFYLYSNKINFGPRPRYDGRVANVNIKSFYRFTLFLQINFIKFDMRDELTAQYVKSALSCRMEGFQDYFYQALCDDFVWSHFLKLRYAHKIKNAFFDLTEIGMNSFRNKGVQGYIKNADISLEQFLLSTELDKTVLANSRVQAFIHQKDLHVKDLLKVAPEGKKALLICVNMEESILNNLGKHHIQGTGNEVAPILSVSQVLQSTASELKLLEEGQVDQYILALQSKEQEKCVVQ